MEASMLIARVVGSAVSTIKEPRLTGLKLLIVRETNPQNEITGEPFVAADTVGAGEGELVLVATGSAARQTLKTCDAAVDAAIVGVIDSLEENGETVFIKE
jgi:ethanolamine utilization protein EutN